MFTTHESGGYGNYEFKLEVDGVYLKPSYVIRSVLEKDSEYKLLRLWGFNFPQGMTGEHEFVGHWYGVCKSEYPLNPHENCKNPNAQVEYFANSVYIIFND